MRARFLSATLIGAALLAAQPAYACRISHPLNFDHIQHADVIVVGRISHYEIVGDHARLRIAVRQTLRGVAPTTLAVDWFNSTFVLPRTMTEGDYLLALTPLGGARRAGDSPYLVLQAPCSPAFLFPANSDEARAVRERIAQ